MNINNAQIKIRQKSVLQMLSKKENAFNVFVRPIHTMSFGNRKNIEYRKQDFYS